MSDENPTPDSSGEQTAVKGPAGRVKLNSGKNVTPTEGPWIANWCRPGSPSWSHERCKGTLRNGSLAPRVLMICECPNCHGNSNHSHSPEEIEASKLRNPAAGTAKRTQVATED